MLDLDTAVDWNERVITFRVSPRTKAGDDESWMLSVSCNSIVMLPCPELPTVLVAAQMEKTVCNLSRSEN